MSVTSLNLASLDFNTINNDLKKFYSSKEEWKDYDFTSEGLATTLLMDIESSITYKLNVYANANLNETFLSTAKTRDAVVRKAKMLNYRVQSANAADAKIRLTFQTNTFPAQIIIPKYTRFSAQDLNGNSYEFLTTQTYYCTPDTEYNYVIDIDVVQGTLLQYAWTVTNDQKVFTIPNTGVDTKRMEVLVKESESDLNWISYYESSNILNNTSTSTVYFVQEGPSQLFQIYFGDDIVGKAIKNGNIINISYIVTEGTNGNNLTTFNLLDTLTYPCTIETITPSGNGKNIESISSIKRYAPKYRNTQNRAVNAEDFEVIIKQNIPQIDSVSTWGGEENNPPYYGKVCISAITSSNYTLSDTLKEQVSNLFDSNNIIGSKQLYWIDPQLVNVIVNLQVYYDSTTTLSQNDLDLILRYGISTFNTTVRQFNYTFDLSVFVEFLKSLNPAFVDIIITNNLQYQSDNYLDTDYMYIDFQNSITEGSVSSNRYFNSSNIVSILRDDGQGNIHEYVNNNGVDIISNANVGTVNYTTGEVTINNLHIVNLLGDTYFRINATPTSNKIESQHNILLNIPFDLAVINMVSK